MLKFFLDNAGLFAYLVAGANVLSFVALFIFFAGVPAFGPINDALSVFQFLFMVPLVVALHWLMRANAPTVSLIATVAAVLASLAIAVLQAGLVVGLVRFEQTLRPILILGSVVGLWWLVMGVLSLGEPAFPAGLSWASVISGVSFIAIAIGFWVGGQQHPLAAVGFLAGAVAVTVWAVWLGRLLTSGQLAILT